MTDKERLTTDKRKIFARESLTIMSMNKDELRKHYNEIFDRLQEYEVAEEQGQLIRPPCKVGDTLYRIIKMSTGIDRKIINTKSGGIITPCKPTIKKFIRTVTVTKNNYLDCCKNFGITVFASREEAKKALKGGER